MIGIALFQGNLIHQIARRVTALNVRVLLSLLLWFGNISSSYAGLMIEITQGVDNPVSVAVVPFAWQGYGLLKEDVAAIIAADLERSGQFKALPREDMLAHPHKQADVHFSEWRTDYLLVGQVKPGTGNGQYEIKVELFDVFNRKRLAHEVMLSGIGQLRRAAHHISDLVYEKLTGYKGVFSTRLLYVSVMKGEKEPYRLNLSDVDGHGEMSVFRSAEPIMSPVWAPNGEEIAYVSFETKRPAIYRHTLATGKREKLTGFPGLNSSPAWSPDGQSMAMVLSKDGNPEVYVMNLKNKRLRRITNHFSIDTEPSWMPDGKSIIFTSSRGGKPQIYQVNLASNWIERLTFEGEYNARSRVLPDGKGIVFVHRRDGVYHIATQEVNSGELRVLTETELDESPSVAPNGSILMYATQVRGGQGILGAVSLDGKVKYRLPSGKGDVREPAWSPYFQ